MPVVPSLDISPLLDGSPDEVARCAAAIDAAGRETGFLSVTGHGVPAALTQQMLDSCTALFDLPAATKQQYVVAERAANRGYAGPGTEALAYSIGQETPPDLFEAFNVGWEFDAAQRAELVGDGLPFFAANVWPSDAEVPDLRATWLAYWDAMHELGRVLLQGCALALGLERSWFEPFVARTASVMRAINYERFPGSPDPLPDQMRMGAHTDYGSLTILLADPVPGLQIRRGGEWHDVVPEPGAFLVNIGDLLAEWTNDRWHSTLHRVVPPPRGADGRVRRRSVAWFQQPDPDAVIAVLPSMVSADFPARYPSVTSGDHLMAKLMGPRTGRASEVDAVFTGATR